MEPSKGNIKGRRKTSEQNKETRSYFTWNLEMKCVLAEVVGDKRNLGNKSDKAWKRVAYNIAAT